MSTNNCGCHDSYTICQEPCPPVEPLNTNDIPYVGESDTCVKVVRDSTLTQVLDNIRTFIKNRLFGVVSNSLVVTYPPYTCDRVAKIEIVPSNQAGNTFVLGNDGKPYVPASTAAAGRTTVVADGQCITFTKTTVGNVDTYTPVIDFSCVAAQVCGLCAPTSCGTPGSLTIT